MFSFLIWSTLLIALGQGLDDAWEREIADKEVLRLSSNARNEGSYWVTKGEYFLGTEAEDEIGDDFSSELSGDGTTIVYGTYEWNTNTGKVVVMQFDESSQSWKQKGETLTGSATGEDFGRTCSISSDGNTIAIGSDVDYAWVYQWDSTESKYVMKGAKFDNTASFGYVGKTILLSNDGNSVLIGYGSGSDTARMAFYDWDGSSSWTRRGGWIVPPDGADSGSCAEAISMARQTKDKVAMYCNGPEKSWAFAWNADESKWKSTGGFDAPHDLSIEVEDDDYWGAQMSMSDDGTYLMMTGYYMYDPDKNTEISYYHGGFQVVKWDGMNWRPHGSIVFGMADSAEAGYYGAAMSRDGSTVCMSEDDPSYVVTCHKYHEEIGEWMMKGLPLVLQDEEHRLQENHLGEAMSLSADGNVLSFGVPNLSTPSFEERGAVIVMKWHENFLSGIRVTKRVLNLGLLLHSGNSQFKWNKIQKLVGKIVFMDMEDELKADAVTAFSSWYQYTRQDYSESNFNGLKDAVGNFIEVNKIDFVQPAKTLWHDHKNPNFRRKM